MTNDPIKADIPYQIYSYVQPGKSVNKYVAPWELDFKTQLSTSLHPVREFNLGSRTKTTRYAVRNESGVHTIPVVRVDYVWTFDTNGLAKSVQPTITWYLNDGTDGPHPKIMQPKYYSPEEVVSESRVRRTNQVNTAGKVAIGALMAIESMSESDAYMNGRGYWQTLSSEIIAYKEGDAQALKDRINNDTIPAWVANIKVPILNELV